MQKQIKMEQLRNLHQFIKNGASLEDVLELIGYFCANFNICSFIVNIISEVAT